MREKIEELSKSLPKNLLQKVVHLKNSVPIEELHTWSQGLEGSKLISDIWEVAKILTEISTVNKGVIGIYKITSPSDKVYVGQAKCISLRWKKYKSNLAKGQTRLHNSFSKYGTDKHKFEIIEICEQEDLDTKERYWQEHYNVLGEKGLNCELVSTKKHKRVFTEESRLRMSESLRNRVPSEKTLAALAACRLAMNISKVENTKEKLKAIILNWDVHTQGRISISKIQKLKTVGRHSVDKYYKEFKELVAEVNNF